jgi:hypothetical protein
LTRILERYKGTWVEAPAKKEKEDLEKVIGAPAAGDPKAADKEKADEAAEK